MQALLQYLYYRITKPEVIDFVDMGLGIASRARRLRKSWLPHLALSKDFLRRSLDAGITRGGTVSILGAGRLLDVDMDLLTQRFQRIALYDYDPSVLLIWKRAQRRYSKSVAIDLHQCDLTGSLQQWTEGLHRVISTESGEKLVDDLVKYLRHLASLPSLKPSIEDSDLIVSLNLLGQIPIYWRERVQRAISRFRIPEEEIYHIESALEPTLRKLQIDHQDLVMQKSPRQVVYLYDFEFYSYQPHLAPWEVNSSLFAPEPRAESPYAENLHDSWFWHIVPWGKESAEFGSIHRVHARSFLRA